MEINDVDQLVQKYFVGEMRPYHAQCAVATAALAILTRRLHGDSRAETWDRVMEDLFALRCYVSAHIMVGTKDRRAAEDIIEQLRLQVRTWKKNAEK